MSDKIKGLLAIILPIALFFGFIVVLAGWLVMLQVLAGVVSALAIGISIAYGLDRIGVFH